MTSKKLEKLTPDQIAKFPEYREKWLKIGLSTAPLDRTRAAKAIDKVYECAGLAAPKIKVFLDSPYAGAFGSVYLKELDKATKLNSDQVGNQVGNQVWNQVGNQVWDQVWNQVWNQIRDQVGNQVWNQIRDQVRDQVGNQVGNQVRDQVWNQVWNQIRDQVRDQVWNQIRDQVGNQVWNQIRDQVRDQVWNQVGNQVWNQVWNQIRDQVRDQVGDQVRDQVGNQVGNQVRDQVRDQVGNQVGDQVRDQVWDQVWKAGYGSQDAGWLSFYNYFLEQTNLKVCEKLSGLTEFAKEAGWFFPFENAVIITPRSSLIKLDDRGRLHCENGPAIQYPDGWSIYAWHGIRIPEEWIKDKSVITPKLALTYPDMEKRRAACEILGWAKVLKKLKAKTIDKDPNPMIGELLEVELPDVGKERFLRVQCGTGREFALCVTQFGHKTARECNAATYGWNPGLPIENFIPETRT
jgi:hypothetical protein